MAALLRNFVGGEWIETGKTFANINPVDGSKVCDVSDAEQSTVARAVNAARTAMNGEWGPDECRRPIGSSHRVTDRIEVRFDDFLEAEIADTGRRRIEDDADR